MVAELGINLVATIVGALAIVVWRRWLEGLLLERFKEPTKLAAEYIGTLDFGTGPNHEISLRLRKSGNRVQGALRFTRGKHAGKEYHVTGRYSHGLLTFVYWPYDPTSTSQGTATYQRREDGQLLYGYFVYHSQSEDRVATVKSDMRPA